MRPPFYSIHDYNSIMCSCWILNRSFSSSSSCIVYSSGFCCSEGKNKHTQNNWEKKGGKKRLLITLSLTVEVRKTNVRRVTNPFLCSRSIVPSSSSSSLLFFSYSLLLFFSNLLLYYYFFLPSSSLSLPPSLPPSLPSFLSFFSETDRASV